MVLAAAVLPAGCSPTSVPPSPSVAAGPTTSVAAPPLGVAPTCPALGAEPSEAVPAGLGQPAWWRGRVFYEVFVRSFADSDGDGIGDLRGLTARLDYLNDGDSATTADLGITGIWLMPIAASPSYHGYDVTDERSVESDYGSLDDLRALVAAAHERGIAVITDLVLNHTSDRHPWFRDSLAGGDRRDWYVWSDENPGYGGPDGQAVWHPAGGRWYYGVFGSGLPDLDVSNPEVTAELDEVARFWIRETGLDGFRLDAIKHLVEDGQTQVHTGANHAWLAAFRSRLHEAAPNVLLVGEVYDLSVAVARYVPEEVDLAFDFERGRATLDSIRRGDGGPLSAALVEDGRLFAPSDPAGFLTNHDQARVATELREELPSMRLAAGLLLTGGGTPFVYYGEEIGLPGAKPDELIRTPMPWTDDAPAAGFSTARPWQPLQPGWERRNVATQAGDPSSLLATYRDLIRLRAAHPALALGATLPLSASDPAVVGYIRAAGDAHTAVVANVSDRAVAGARLSLEAGLACAPTSARVVYPAPTDAATADRSTPTVAGSGFSDWMPVPELPARSLTVIELGG